jgi:hypothetical protein
MTNHGAQVGEDLLLWAGAFSSARSNIVVCSYHSLFNMLDSLGGRLKLVIGYVWCCSDNP